MIPTFNVECKLASGVEEFLKDHDAEADFRSHCELVRSCFPDLRAIQVRLLEDPDEENHTWVGLHVFLPPSYPPELLRAQQRQYYEKLWDLPARPYHPLSFVLSIQFARE